MVFLMSILILNGLFFSSCGSEVPEESTKLEGTLANAKPSPESVWGTRPSAAEFYGIQENQKESEARLDKLNIRQNPVMQTDNSDIFIKVPHSYQGNQNFSVAKTPPVIDFVIVQNLEPQYLKNTDAINQSPMSVSDGFAMWCGFGDVTKGPDGCFYFAIGNHAYINGNTYMIKYNPATKTHENAFDASEVCQWREGDWTDGKIHSDPDISANGDMWVFTFSGPRPLAKEINEVNYLGGNLIHYNVFTGKAENLGVPFEGETWAYGAFDVKNEHFFAVGQARNAIFMYDTKNQKILFAGFPPNGLSWWRRCTMVEKETGKVYSVDSNPKFEGSMHFVSWERHNNTFTVMNSMPPMNPVLKTRTPMRAHTRRKDAEGAFWCFDDNGTIFQFFPQKDSVASVDVNWGEYGKYTSNVCLSPKGRYLYYLPGSHSNAHTYGTPVVQYDTQTKQRKVLAFLNDYYLEKYGYSPYGSFGLELDENGESIVFYTNGLFTTKEDGSGYGRPALFHLYIPESERVE